MAWKTLYYGNETPSNIRKISVHSLYIIFLLSFYGWWNDFIPSPLWLQTSLFIIIFISLLISLFLYREYKRNKTAIKTNASTPKQVLVFLFLPICIFGFLWVAFVHGLSGIFTQILGEQIEIITVMEKEHSYSSKACDFRLRGDSLDGAVPNYICTSETHFNNFPDEPFSVKLSGKQSFVGFHVSEIYRTDEN